jgi:hypothetical protein
MVEGLIKKTFRENLDLIKYLFILVALVLILYLVVSKIWSDYAYRYEINRLPAQFNITNIIYDKQEASFGPGGSENGLIVYELPVATKRLIIKYGLNYLNLVAKYYKDPRDYRKNYSNFKQTPLIYDIDMIKKYHVQDDSSKNLKIFQLSDIWSGFFKIDASLEIEINKAMSQKGSYFAFDNRHNILLIIPDSWKVVFIYHK